MNLIKKESSATITFNPLDKIEADKIQNNDSFKEAISDTTIENLVIDFSNRIDIDPFVLGLIVYAEAVQAYKGGTLLLKNFKTTNLYRRVKELDLQFNIQ